MDAIFRRRSVRHFVDKKIPKGDLKYLLEAAMAAPSAGNQQPWHFVLMTDKSVFRKIPEFHQYSKMLLEADAAIAVCGNSGNERFGPFWVQDCAAATQNILLAAASKGIGSCWLGIYPREDKVGHVRELLNIPKEFVPFSVIALGYPAEEKGPSNRFDEGRVHYDRW